MSAEDQRTITDLVAWKANVSARLKKLRRLQEESRQLADKLEKAIDTQYRDRLEHLRKEG